MLKKFIPALLALTLMTGMATFTNSFADDVTSSDLTSNAIEKSSDTREGRFAKDKLSIFSERAEKSDRLKNEDGLKPPKGHMTSEQRDAKRAEGQEKRDETLNTMYPEIVQEHSELRSDLQASIDQVKEIKDKIATSLGFDKEADKSEHIAFMDSLKAKLDSNEITREKAKELFDNYREEEKLAHEEAIDMSDENKAKLEEIRLQMQALKLDRETISKDIKEAVNNNDSSAFKVAFDKSMDTLQKSLSLETKKIQILSDVLSNLQ